MERMPDRDAELLMVQTNTPPSILLRAVTEYLDKYSTGGVEMTGGAVVAILNMIDSIADLVEADERALSVLRATIAHFGKVS